MEIKKSAIANLEDKRLMFLLVGVVLALGVTWAAFAWETKETDEAGLKGEVKIEEDMEQEEVFIEEEQKQEMPEEKPEEEEELTDEIEEVEDDEEESVREIIEDKDVEIVAVERNTNIQVEEEEEEVEEVPFALVEVKPSFQGGDANDFSKWVNQRLVYPEIAKENNIQGRVILQFTIDAGGNMTNVKVVRGVDKSLDEEAVRVVKSSPKWTPGRQRDRAAKVTYTFPVIFQLR